jgi:hypothetical protein
LTGFFTFTAANTGIILKGRNKAGGFHWMKISEFFGRNQSFAAATAAVADKGDVVADVFAALNQIVFVGSVKHFHSFRDIYPSGVIMTDQSVGGAPEGHADIVKGGIAIFADVKHFMTAIAHADANVVGGLDALTGPFKIENLNQIITCQDTFVDKNPAQSGFGTEKKFFHEILFNIHVLVKQFPQELLVNIVAGSHHRKLQKSRHWRRKQIAGFLGTSKIHQNTTGTKGIQYCLSFFFG